MNCTDPPLTTVRQPIESMGKAAVALLVNQIENVAVYPEELLFEPELVVRGPRRGARPTYRNGAATGCRSISLLHAIRTTVGVSWCRTGHTAMRGPDPAQICGMCNSCEPVPADAMHDGLSGGDQFGGATTGDRQRVGPYVLLGRLGSGGMGRVYLARSPGGRMVAVKVIRANLAEDAGFRARFAREVSAARKVGGLFTAQVVDADIDGPVPWLVTAYVPGTSLSDAVQRQGPLPDTSVLALAAGLAEGLIAIHAAGVIHRDLKPSNVLLAQDGPRIIDFGIRPRPRPRR